ncbi:SRPBCC family protein [Acaryochloris sp. CCMEE 5410]|uniref:SRPBCC family protein n=1 Tax=Acaryochloris sp. CCMEE 5410 TaxID=310037 RepID=UPI0002484AB8|nr:SRPBCC family protein [Acaryochloris sp. CCMEE 5410]KAI9132317.1 SRPBCC family protein [Acaryochloris sp. CCMEE 5410]
MTPQFFAPKPLSELIHKLPKTDQDDLEQGQVVISGSAGEYVARTVLQASPQAAWEVLTDYDNFSSFLPNVTDTQVLDQTGPKTVVEQTNTCQILLANIESTVLTENVATDAGRIKFRLLDGDLDQLDGYWQIFPLSNPADHILLVQVVTAEANIGILNGGFYDIFEGTLRNNLEAIHSEINRRVSTDQIA